MLLHRRETKFQKFRRKIAWSWIDFKDSISNWYRDKFVFHKNWVRGFIKNKGDNFIEICWPDTDTVLTHKNILKYFKDLKKGDSFKCHLIWGIKSNTVNRIKDVKKITASELTKGV